MTQPTDNAKKWRTIALILGAVLALVCSSLPDSYQTPCRAIAHLCTGGALP